MEGKIITFYSYKGGVGRSMALANIAILMKRWGYKVLMLDWDLEAPGLENFFKDYVSVEEFQKREGIVEILLKHTEEVEFNWRSTIQNIPIEISNSGTLDLITSGIRDENYFKNVRKFDFNDFYANHDGGEFLEELRNEWKTEYDFILVDSRTGVTDIGGVCTVQLPDMVVLLFTATEQSLNGILKVGKKINESLSNLPVERYNIPILPIPSRFENQTEFKIGQEWLDKFSVELLPLVESWMPEEYFAPHKIKQLLEILKIPYIPYFSFGEKLPVVEQGTLDTAGIGYSYETIFTLIVNDLQDPDLLIKNRDKLLSKANKAILNETKSITYDVFLSRKSIDAQYAKKIYDYLTSKGLKVFESAQSLKELGNIDYSKAIDNALIGSTHMIVIGSSVENIKSSWVESEWLYFLNRKRSGKTTGNLFTVITKELKLDDVPPSLANYEVIPFNEKNFPIIYNYVRGESSIPLPQSKHPSRPENLKQLFFTPLRITICLLLAVFILIFYYYSSSKYFSATVILNPKSSLKLNDSYPEFQGGEFQIFIDNHKINKIISPSGILILENLPKKSINEEVPIYLKSDNWKIENNLVILKEKTEISIIPDGSLSIISGNIKASTGKSIVGVTVDIDNDTTIMSDNNGNFNIKLPYRFQKSFYALHFQKQGFPSIHEYYYPKSGNGNMDVRLKK